MMNNIFTGVFSILAVFCISPSIADNAQSLDCTFTAKYEGEEFIELFNKSKQVSSVFCKQYIQYLSDRRNFNGSKIQLTLVEYSAQAKQALNAKVKDESEAYAAQFMALSNTFSVFDYGDARLPEIVVERSIRRGESAKAYFTSLTDKDVQRINIDQAESCTSSIAGRACAEIYEDFKGAFNPYRTTYNNVYDNTLLLSHLASRWDEFLELSKSQTALEVVLTTWWHRNHFKEDHIVGPPDSQVIALHPRLIFAYIDKAADGSNADIGLAVEWLGLNYWDWKVPFGFSVTSTYMDRADLDDVGHGVMLHFYNHYSIGWSDHGDKNAVYFSLDLLKLFQGKKQQYASYINNYF